MYWKSKTLLISTCSIGTGIGYFLGKKSVTPATLSESENSNRTFVFPSAQAKSLVKKSDKNLDSPNRKKDNLSSSLGELVKYGIPSMENIRTYEDFILSYDKRNRTANWVLEHLTQEKVDKKGSDRASMKFIEDESFHVFHRSTNKDFQGSGYDRGHLAAAANHRYSKSAMKETFILSNVSPQVGEGFNRDAWNNLEKYTRAVVRRSKNVHVCTGPLYLPRVETDGKLFVKYEVIGNNHVAVPTHFFKVLLIENEKGEKELQSFVMENKPLPGDIKLKHYLIPLDTIERAAGLIFFDRLSKDDFKRINAIAVG